jgi:putative N-acetylmannosamine-6-phosphate epimerase
VKPRYLLLPLAAAAIFGLLLFSGCAPGQAIGAINDRATVALIRYESQEGGVDGVVYREVNQLDTLLARSDVPVLVVFYDSMDPVNSLIIPMLEQMADDLQGRIQIVWIDAQAEQALAASFQVERLPQFTVVVEASLKRSLIGFDDEGQQRVRDLIASYLDAS